MKLTVARARNWSATWLPLKAIAWGCRKYLLAYNNEHRYDMSSNGEYWLVDRVSRLRQGGQMLCVDVGANHGNWTAGVLNSQSSARVILFEMLPIFRDRLRQRFKDNASVTIMECGLSDSSQNTTGYQTGGGGQLVIRPTSNKIPVATEVELKRGDDALSEFDLDKIHLFKIDTDGHELSVLRGLSATLDVHQPVVQFEYPEFTRLQRAYLKDIYDFLEAKGYVVGLLMPRSVAIGPYDKRHENFLTKNFVAIPSILADGFTT